MTACAEAEEHDGQKRHLLRGEEAQLDSARDEGGNSYKTGKFGAFPKCLTIKFMSKL